MTNERVARGIEVLDAVEPGWRDRIDLATLDMANPYLCIRGQLYGHFLNHTPSILLQESVDLGFDFYGWPIPAEDYIELTAEWIEALS